MSKEVIVLIEHVLLGKNFTIGIEHTSNGGRANYYAIDGQEVSREMFVVAMKLCEATSFEKIASGT